MTDTTDRGAIEEMTKAAELLRKVARPVINLIFAAIPITIKLAQIIYKFYAKLPIVYVQLSIGFLFCFFGGLYPAVFAAIQAAQHGGITAVMRALISLSEEATIIVRENEKDNKTDADGDGDCDVDELSSEEFTQRKVKLVLTKMNPEKVNDAISSLYKVWMSVIAVLTVKFAKTIALALTIGEFFEKIMNRLVAPIIQKALPVEYRKWVPVLIDWLCKGIGVSVAWTIQSVISAFTSALAGGLIMSRAILVLVAKGKDHHDTYIDEAVSYLFAGVGFYFQYFFGFSTPFPLNIFMWPIDLAEHYIRWSVTK